LLSQALFKGGGGAYLEVLDAQRSLFAAQQDLIELRRVEQVNRLTIYNDLLRHRPDLEVTTFCRRSSEFNRVQPMRQIALPCYARRVPWAVRHRTHH